jgi:hemolysin III
MALGGEALVGTTSPQQPLLRGYLHVGAFVASFAGTAVMLLLAHSTRGYVGASVFGASLIVAYGTSAAYHRGHWTGRRMSIVRRLDHATIFFLIAGTYTPFCLLALRGAWGPALLSVAVTIAAVGAGTRLVWLDSPRWLAVPLYLASGWVALIAVSQVLQVLDPAPLGLLFGGGVAYSVGALAYATKRPDPWPKVFGYHEVFHSLTIMGSTLHFLAVSLFVLRA